MIRSDQAAGNRDGRGETARSEQDSLAETVRILNELGLHLRYEVCAPPAETAAASPMERPAAEASWVPERALAFPDAEPQASMLDRLAANGFGSQRKALSASVMLRYGWSAGFAIGAYLALGRVPVVAEYALRLSPTLLLSAVGVVRAEWAAGERTMLRQRLADALLEHAAPIVEAHHAWSRLSRKALWSMTISSWAAQFVRIGERLDSPEFGLREAEAVLAIHPVVRASTPDLYTVRAGGRRGVCQIRRSCCLYFKGPKRTFCASCPIVPEAERLALDRARIAAGGFIGA